MDRDTIAMVLNMIHEDCKANREFAARLLQRNENRLQQVMELIARLEKEEKGKP